MVAAGGGVLVDEDTYKETMNQIAYKEKQMIKVKGKVEEFPVYRPVDIRYRTEAQVRGQEVTMFGRDKEIKAIVTAFNGLNQSYNFHGTALVFCGHMGMGKTRMLSFVSAFALSRKVRLIEGMGVDIESGVPFFPWSGMFAQLANFDECLTEKEKINSITKLFNGGENYEAIIHLIKKIFPSFDVSGEDVDLSSPVLSSSDNVGIYKLMRDAIQGVINDYIHRSKELVKHVKKNKLVGDERVKTDVNEIAMSSNVRNRMANAKMSMKKDAQPVTKKKSESKLMKTRSGLNLLGTTLAKSGSILMKKGDKDAVAAVAAVADEASMPILEAEQTDFHRIALSIDDAHNMDSLSWDALLFIIDECQNLLTFITLIKSKYDTHEKHMSDCKNVKMFTLASLGKLDVENMVKELIMLEKDPSSGITDYWSEHKLDDSVSNPVSSFLSFISTYLTHHII
jgi:hypothetical protein